MTARAVFAFKRRRIAARIIDPDGRVVERPVEVRTHPITGRSCRITLARSAEQEPGAGAWPEPPPQALDPENCPFCPGQLTEKTPRLTPRLAPEGRMKLGRSILFPNLFPYGSYSAVSLMDQRHFVEIGTADVSSYADCLANCTAYLKRVLAVDPRARYMAITQNHLPSAGGSLIHPHLQVHADRMATNHQRVLFRKALGHHKKHGTDLLSDYLNMEIVAGERMIGRTGNWQWLAAFAPEGFYEIWGILPGVFSFDRMTDPDTTDLAQGVCRAQRFFRHLNRNGYNLGILSVAAAGSRLELRAVLRVRSNYAPWTRSDHTGFEVMLGDMATFTLPEETAATARAFWDPSHWTRTP